MGSCDTEAFAIAFDKILERLKNLVKILSLVALIYSSYLVS